MVVGDLEICAGLFMLCYDVYMHVYSESRDQ